MSLRSGDAMAHVRMNAINRDKLKHYFDLLKESWKSIILSIILSV